MSSLLNMSGGSLLEKGLPYDAEIEYLESSGTQWIDTLFCPNQNTSVEVKANWKNTDNTELFGARSSRRYYELLIQRYLYYQYGNQFPSKTSPYFSAIATYKCEKNILYVNGEIFVSATANDFSITKSLYLYALNGEFTTASRKATAKMYYCKIWDNDALVRDFIPVRVGNVGYMYDKVSKQLFGNAGTGNFILGNDI